MVGTLLPRLDLAELYARVARRVREHGAEKRVGHKVRARACRQIPAPRQNLHGAAVDLAVAAPRVFDRRAAFRKGGRVENDIVPRLFAALPELREQLEHIRLPELHAPFEPVAFSVAPRLFERGRGHVHCRDALRASGRAVERKCAGVRKAVEHAPPMGQPPRRGAVIFLVEEIAGLLAVYVVHVEIDAVFADLRVAGGIYIQSGCGIRPLAAGHALLFADERFVALINARNVHAERRKLLAQQRIEHRAPLLDAEREHLAHEHIAIAVHRPAGEAVRFAENETAGGEVFAHDLLPVGERIPDAAAEKRLVHFVVRVAREDAHADERAAVIKPRALPAALFGIYVHDLPVRAGVLLREHLPGEHPGMPAAQSARGLFRDGNACKRSFHRLSSCFVTVYYTI